MGPTYMDVCTRAGLVDCSVLIGGKIQQFLLSALVALDMLTRALRRRGGVAVSGWRFAHALRVLNMVADDIHKAASTAQNTVPSLLIDALSKLWLE